MTIRSAGIGSQSAFWQRCNQRMMAGSNLLEPGHADTVPQY